MGAQGPTRVSPMEGRRDNADIGEMIRTDAGSPLSGTARLGVPLVYYGGRRVPSPHLGWPSQQGRPLGVEGE